VSRERVAGVALRAYPTAERAARGEEMLATLLDVSAGSRTEFARELADVTRIGLRARARQTASAGTRRLIADGLCLAATWVMTLDLSTLLSQKARGVHDPLLAWPSIALLGAVLAIALVGIDRLAGAGALVWTALRLPALMDHHSGLTGLLPELLPLICFAVMVLAPRRRAPDLHRLAWLIVPAALVLTLGPSNDDQNQLLLAAGALAALAVALFALASLSTDPRLAIAGAVPLSNLGIAVAAINHDTSVPARLFLAAAPAVLAVAITRTRRLRQRGPQRL